MVPPVASTSTRGSAGGCCAERRHAGRRCRNECQPTALRFIVALQVLADRLSSSQRCFAALRLFARSLCPAPALALLRLAARLGGLAVLRPPRTTAGSCVPRLERRGRCRRRRDRRGSRTTGARDQFGASKPPPFKSTMPWSFGEPEHDVERMHVVLHPAHDVFADVLARPELEVDETVVVVEQLVGSEPRCRGPRSSPGPACGRCPCRPSDNASSRP